MSGLRIGPLQGYRTGADGGRPNGLPESATRGYRRHGNPDWDPAKGRHEDPSVVARPGAQRHARAQAQRAERDARVDEFARLRASGMKPRDIAAEMGLSVDTIYDYAQTLRKRDGAT